MGDEIFESGYSNSQGFVRLPIPSSETGEVLVTVTKKNHYPYQNSFQIHDPGVSINVGDSPFTIDDDNSGESIGNGNMIANGGETLELFVSAKNYGSEDAVNVTGYISTSSSYVSIDSTGSVSDFGNVAVGETVEGSTPFIVTLAEGLQDGADPVSYTHLRAHET